MEGCLLKEKNKQQKTSGRGWKVVRNGVAFVHQMETWWTKDGSIYKEIGK